MIPIIFCYTWIELLTIFLWKIIHDVAREFSFSRRKSKVCTWHCIIPKVIPSLLYDERTRTSSLVPLFQPRSPRNGSFVAWLAVVNQYPHPPYGVTTIVIPSLRNVINAVVLPMHAARNNVTSTDGVTVSSSTLARHIWFGIERSESEIPTWEPRHFCVLLIVRFRIK